MDELLNKHFKKIALFDHYKVDTEDDEWYLLPREKCISMTEEVISDKRNEKDFFVLGYNDYRAYLILDKVDGSLYKYSSQDKKLINLEITFDEVVK